ncbi:MAG: right-handed parallel beta-helix repeat-containing protein, partial [Methanosarcinaceae archaeon]|nr:right-handed parallel beta-helix repeat-containing protein [Methanosarcinaceae archaeon]
MCNKSISFVLFACMGCSHNRKGEESVTRTKDSLNVSWYAKIKAHSRGLKLMFRCLLACVFISNIAGPNATAQTYVPSSISTNKTWTAADNPYVVNQDVTVEAGVTLTIESGVIVKFYECRSLYVKGDLIADGVSGAEIIFTSIKDDSDGHDTNGDGTASTPAPRDWGGLYFADTCTGSLLNHVVVRYSGREWSSPLWRAVPTLYIATSNLTISSSTITENGNEGIKVYQCDPTIQNNTITNNGGDGIYLYSASPTISGNMIANNGGYGIVARLTSNPQILGNSLEGNTRGAICVDPSASGSTIQGNELLGLRAGIFVGAGELTADATWSSDSVYVIEFGGQDIGGLTVVEGATLTIDPGVVIKFTQNASLKVKGDLVAEGTPEEQIIFTSLNDDSYGGDTNGDGDTTTAAKNDWGDMVFWDTCTGSVLNNIVVKHAGQSWSSPFWYSLPAVIGLTSNLIIANSTIADNGQDGISVRLGSPVVRDNMISNNVRYGIELRAASPMITGNTIIGNAAGISYALDSGGNVYLNDFLSNTNHVSGLSSNIVWWSPEALAYTYGGNSYINYLGNYWDDYQGIDALGDGIGFPPYSVGIDFDNYPLMMPFENYGIGEEPPEPPENQPPVASFTYSPNTSIRSGDTVMFDAGASEDPDGGEIVSYEWNFEDGEPLTSDFYRMPHRFRGSPIPGLPKLYHVTLIVTDNEGTTATYSSDVVVSPVEKIIPVSPGFWNILWDKCALIKPTYNWVGIDDTTGEDLYIISKMDFSTTGIQGAYFLMITRGDSFLPEIRWQDIILGGFKNVSYETPFKPTIGDFLGIPLGIWSPDLIVKKSFYEGNFEGLEVHSLDVVNVIVAATALLPPVYFDTAASAFEPDAPVVDANTLLKGTLKGLLWILKVMSPVELRVYDDQNHVTGIVNGEIYENIPNSAYTGEDETVVMLAPESSSYYCELIGKDQGTYGFTACIFSIENEVTKSFVASDIPISSDVMHRYYFDWEALSRGEEG